jgi:hypothetical protein
MCKKEQADDSCYEFIDSPGLRQTSPVVFSHMQRITHKTIVNVATDPTLDVFNISDIMRVPMLKHPFMRWGSLNGFPNEISLFSEIQLYKTIESSSERKAIARDMEKKYLIRGAKTIISDKVLLSELKVKWGERYMFEDVEAALRKDLTAAYIIWSKTHEFRILKAKYEEYVRLCITSEINSLM